MKKTIGNSSENVQWRQKKIKINILQKISNKDEKKTSPENIKWKFKNKFCRKYKLKIKEKKIEEILQKMLNEVEKKKNNFWLTRIFDIFQMKKTWYDI